MRLPLLAALSFAFGTSMAGAQEPSALGINFYHSGGVLVDTEWAGSVRLPRWNNVLVPGGPGAITGSPGFGPIALSDFEGRAAGAVTSTVASYYNGDSGTTVASADGLLMSEYVSWDPPGDGVAPDDEGRMRISGLGEAFTTSGYDVFVYCDADVNNRTFTVTVGGRSVVGADSSTFDGEFRRAAGVGSDANLFVFEDLDASEFTLDVASSTGRAAVNGLQIIANGFVAPEEPGPPDPPPPGDGPNIVLFVVDDMGWQDTSVPFHTERTPLNALYNTPHMASLAARGMRFTQAYASSPVCSPSRVSMITGMNPARTRVTDWVGHGESAVGALRSAVWQQSGLQPNSGFATLPRLLHDAGYRTIHVGKAHFGHGAGAAPTRHGFDVNIGGSGVGSPRGQGAAGRYFGPFGAEHPSMESHGQGAYITNALTTEAAAAIRAAHADGYPFFLHLSHYAVHTPLGGQGDPAYVGNYADRPNPEDDYAAMLESMDESLGDVVGTVLNLGLEDDTLIVFVSDHGGLSASARANTADPDDPWQRHHHNAPLASGKGSALEGGVRIPLIFGWAGQTLTGPTVQPDLLPIPAGVHCDVPVRVEDLFPTLLAVAGVEGPPAETIDGVDLAGLLAGDRSLARPRPMTWHYPHKWGGNGPGIQPFSSIRIDDWKAIYYYATRTWTLYDLASDLSETTDLAASQPEVVRVLAEALIDSFDEVDATLPRLRPGESLTFELTGTSYSDGERSEHDGDTIALNEGDEVPIVVQDFSRLLLPPPNVLATTAGATSLRVTWDAPTLGRTPTGFHVYRTAPAPRARLTGEPIDGLEFVVDGLDPNALACVVVTSLGAEGEESRDSERACAVVGAAPSISVNLFKSDAVPVADFTVRGADVAGIAAVGGPHWNNVAFDPAGPFQMVVPLRDDRGDASAATLRSTLGSAYVGNSGVDFAAVPQSGDRDMMASYISWDVPDDGVGPNDQGTIAISGLGEEFTAEGYDLFIYADADRNDRTFRMTVAGRTVTLVDNATFAGEFNLAGSGVNENVAVFADLDASSFEIRMDSSTGRGAVNGLQIIARGEAPTAQPQQPGDCNQDGRVDLSDGVCLLNYLFLGVAELPCDDEGGTMLTDWNGSARSDLSDAVALLNYLFTGGPPHALGRACVEIEGCPRGPGC